MTRTKKSSLLAAWISLLSNICLTVIKIIIGFLFNSPVLIADGVHNAADVVSSVVAVVSIRISSQPADEDHPYGHGKAEVIASGIVGLILFLASLLIGYKSIESLLGTAIEAHRIVLMAAVVSLIWKESLYIYTIRVGKKVKSKSLVATAYDHLADVYASLAAVIGIGVALLGDSFDIPWAKYGDPLAGIIVALLIMKLSVSMGKESTGILMEKNAEPDKLEHYRSLVMSLPSVKRVDRIRARELGSYSVVDIRVGVLGTISVQEGHDIGKMIKRTIIEDDPSVQEVLVHLNPWYAEN